MFKSGTLKIFGIMAFVAVMLSLIPSSPKTVEEKGLALKKLMDKKIDTSKRDEAAKKAFKLSEAEEYSAWNTWKIVRKWSNYENEQKKVNHQLAEKREAYERADEKVRNEYIKLNIREHIEMRKENPLK